jgi:DNA-binding transcriptional regulator YiaG
MKMAQSIEDVIESARRRIELPPVAERRPIRESAHITQAEFARALRVDTATISNYENGKREPRGRMREAYADLLGRLKEVVG